MKFRIISIRRWLKSKKFILSVILVIVLLAVINYDGLYYFGYRVFHVLSYISRPIWDKQINLGFTDLVFFGSNSKSKSSLIGEYTGRFG